MTVALLWEGRKCSPRGSRQSKWNRVFHISMNWRGRPLVSYEVIVDLIGSATARTGLRSAPSVTVTPTVTTSP